jgi:CMP-N,N'-diacetyllegionaminic acid synthase
MYLHMQAVAAVIPARLDSQGIPRKPLAPLRGRPLIAWTIEAALEASEVSTVYVSTESEEIADVASKLGASVIVRPSALATGTVPASAVIQHAMESCAPHEFFAYLQPTSPLRTGSDINECLRRLKGSGANAIASVSPLAFPAEWIVTINAQERIRSAVGRKIPRRRQEGDTYYVLNGAIFAARWRAIQAHGDIYRLDPEGYVMSPERGIDIDTQDDLDKAEQFLSSCSTESAGNPG